MDVEDADHDRLQRAYKAAVDTWVTAIRAEEALASVNHTVADVEPWEMRTSWPGRPVARRKPPRRPAKRRGGRSSSASPEPPRVCAAPDGPQLPSGTVSDTDGAPANG
jgi:hypothetical protein